ncbi:MAG: hypothetical protein ACUVWR_06585 [Anaerolineae bacterium]
MGLKRLLILLLVILSACGREPQPLALATLSVPIRQSEGVQSLALTDLPRYNLALLARPQDSTLAGRATIRYVNTAPAELREVYLRLYPNMKMYGGRLDITRVSVDGHDVPFVMAGKDTDLKVPLPRTLPPRRAALIEIDFSLRYQQLKGEYDFFGEKEGAIVLPDFYPILAPLIAGEWRLDPSPGYGDAAFSQVSLYELEITVPEGYQAIAPGSLSEQANSDGSVTYHIASGLSRNIGLVITKGYEREELSVGEVTLASYALPQDRTAARAALTHAAATLAYCEQELAPYPNKQLTLVRVPLQLGNAQTSGLIFLGSKLFGENRPGLEQAVVVGVTRQWWGLTVGSDPLRDPWLDEALTAFTSFLYLRQTHGSQAAAAQEQSWRQVYEQAIKTGLDGPLAQPLAAYGNSARYDMLVSNKGPLFWVEIGDLLGQEGALTIMRQLQRQYAYSFLDTANLNATISRLAGPPATALVEKWILGFQE